MESLDPSILYQDYTGFFRRVRALNKQTELIMNSSQLPVRLMDLSTIHGDIYFAAGSTDEIILQSLSHPVPAKDSRPGSLRSRPLLI